jgi:nucleoside-diphosphate-sugar epimerase
VTGADIARELGLTPVPIPGGLSRAGARLLTALPGGGVLPPITDWVEAASHPSIMDTSKAQEMLGWTPRFTALESLQVTLRPDG